MSPLSSKIFVSVLIALCVLTGAIVRTHQRAASQYFSSALKDAHISVSVEIGKTRYDVANGIIVPEDKSISDREKYHILQRAYELALANRAPLLDIAGVDALSLESAVDHLSRTQMTLAGAQEDSHDSAMIGSLYPITFLNDLAALRTARSAFLASGSDADALVYQNMIKRTVNDKGRDLGRFQRAFNENAALKNYRFPTLAGTISRSSMLDVIGSLRTGLDNLEIRSKDRERCIAGYIRYCDENELILVPPLNEPAEAPGPISIPLNTGVGESRPDDTYVALNKSTCLGPDQEPYIFAAGDPVGRKRMPLWYSGNAFLSPMEGSRGDYMEYLRTQLDMNYTIVNPLEFYICPDVLNDFASVYSIIAIVRFAQSHTEFAHQERTILLSEPVYREADAVSYLHAVTIEIGAEHRAETDLVQRELEELLHMRTDRAAGLDMLIATMATVNALDANLKADGMPIDISAQNLYMTHTAFPSLLGIGNPVGNSSAHPLRIANADDAAILSQRMIPYSELVKTVPRDVLLHDVATFQSFENIRGQ
jgi:hypothetical protein